MEHQRPYIVCKAESSLYMRRTLPAKSRQYFMLEGVPSILVTYGHRG